MAGHVLVTGGAGFIGSHTVDALIADGSRVRVLDVLDPRVHPLGRPSYLTEEAEFIHGDAADREVLLGALEGIDEVVHLAAHQDYMPDFSSFMHVNAESAALLFELIVANRLPVGRILFASSQSVAGEGLYRCASHGSLVPDPRPVAQLDRRDWDLHCPQCGQYMEPMLIKEEICHPHTVYGISKYAVELIAGNLGPRYGITTICMRYTYVQGTRNSFFNAYSGICRRMALQISNGIAPCCYEDGRQLRDFVNVADVAAANLAALRRSPDGHAVYNVGGGTAVTPLDFANEMLSAWGSPLQPQIPGIYRMGDTRHTVSDTSAISALGWRPTIPFEQTIREYRDWFATFEGTQQYLAAADRAMEEQAVLRRAGG